MTIIGPDLPKPASLFKAPPAGTSTPPVVHFRTEAGRRLGREYDGKGIVLGAFPDEREWPQEMTRETRKHVLPCRDSWNVGASALDRGEAKRAALYADPNLSDLGRDTALREFIKRELLPDFEPAWKALPPAEEHANALGAGLDLLAPLDPKDAATAILHSELRPLLRAMSADERSRYLRFEADDETRRAVLLAPPFASGLTSDAHDGLREHTLAKLDPQRLTEWRFLVRCIHATRRALEASEGLLRAVALEPPRDSTSAKL